MKSALIVGYGSMGRRRIRILKSLIPDIKIICVEKNPERLKAASDEGLTGCESLDEALALQPDYAFVCTSPGHHADIIMSIIEHGISVFTELNLVPDKYEELISTAEKHNAKIFMSSTMLYDKKIQAIMDIVKNANEPLSYIYHIGQYLPDWHPWESYKNFFIGKEETNGVREIYAIQLPWIVKTFGPVKKLQSASQKQTSLDIDFDDSYIATMQHENGDHGVFVADVVSRNAVQYLEIMGENTYVTWNGKPDGLLYFDKEKGEMAELHTYEKEEHIEGYADNVFENEYVDEVKAFLDYVEEDKQPLYTLKDDKYVLSLIDKIGA